MSEWIKCSDRVTHSKLVHDKLYRVRLESGHEINAVFNVYEGGEEVAFLLPITGGELSVTHFLG